MYVDILPNFWVQKFPVKEYYSIQRHFELLHVSNFVARVWGRTFFLNTTGPSVYKAIKTWSDELGLGEPEWSNLHWTPIEWIGMVFSSDFVTTLCWGRTFFLHMTVPPVYKAIKTWSDELCVEELEWSNVHWTPLGWIEMVFSSDIRT